MGTMSNTKSAHAKSDPASAEMLNYIFDTLEGEAVSKWPYNFKKEGFCSNVKQAHAPTTQAGVPSSIELNIEFVGQGSCYDASSVFSFQDDAIHLQLDTLYKKSGREGLGFGKTYMNKHFEFLEAHDKARGKEAQKNPSAINIRASSDTIDNVKNSGSYIWASQGFSFSNERQVEIAQKRFWAFAKNRKIDIAEEDLKQFTLPCHFAAFDCGIKVDNGRGGESPLGEAFLLNHTWQGKWDTQNPNSTQKLYAKRYNSGLVKSMRRKGALKTLGPKFYKTVEKYTNKYGGEKAAKRHRIEAYARLARMKITGGLRAAGL